jgi:hypothetical protein
MIFRNIILPVVLYGCETWLLTLREESWLRVFEQMVLERIFRPKRDEITGEWGVVHVRRFREIKIIYKIFV